MSARPQASSGPAQRTPVAGAPFAKAFAAHLSEAGVLGPAAIERAQRAAAASGDRLDTVLVRLGMLPEAQVAEALAAHLGLPLFRRTEPLAHLDIADRLPPHFVIDNRVLPVREDGETLVLAVVDPFDQLPMESIRFVTHRDVAIELISLSDFERLATPRYGGDAPAADPAQQPHDAATGETDLQHLRDSASEAPIIRLVDQIIAESVEAGASDIYIEPSPTALSVRARVDGVLRVMHDLGAGLKAPVVSRVKILAKLDIAERRLPQDGRIKLAVRGHNIDFRVATIPTADGEAVTLRVLDRSRVDLDFAQLGFDPDKIAAMHQLVEQPNGIILVTGPTGSGKTTTLYTMLKHVNRPSVKIFTVEDPIEYQLAGISQVQVQEAIGLDFPAVLRSILRHHPDMIMIGEIRDQDTARIAVQASLTGHLVFSTLHTNSAAETITRLIDMGIEHFLLGSTVRGILAQRLVRRLCPVCAEPLAMPTGLAPLFEAGRFRCAEPSLRRPVGCARCSGSGYAGQLSIAEILPVDRAVRDAIHARLPGAEIEALARAGGVMSLRDDGLDKVWRGLTTVEEVFRVTNTIGA